MFDHKPSQEEIAKWFAGFKLHDGLEHSRYVGGIVAIENKMGGKSTWSLYINATARISYFWDWVDQNDYVARIDVDGPHDLEIHLPEDKKSRQIFITATITVATPKSFDSVEKMLIRKSSGKKQVGTTIFRRGYNGAPGVVFPDNDAIMKAETGAIARALGSLGMLALPGSGLATAEDMLDYLESSNVTTDSPVESKRGSSPKTKAVPNPKV